MEHKFSLDEYQKVLQSMVATSQNFCDDRYLQSVRNYGLEEVEDIINSGNVERLQRLSWNYFWKDGIYKRILLYYATLLTYAGVLIPNSVSGKKLSESALSKKFHSAVDYVENIQLPRILQHMALTTLIYGTYYGVVQTATKENLVILDLPPRYCRSRAKDIYGRDLIEFNTSYFNTISNPKLREEVLNTYPKEIRKAYRTALKGGTTWMEIPPTIGVCFSFVDGNRPLFASVIPATIKYDMAVDLERERDLEEIRKIIVQQIPHLADGALLFEPPEAEAMHNGTVQMMSTNKNVSVLTTYGEVQAITSHTNSEAVTNKLEKNEQHIYSTAGLSKEIFAPSGSQSLSTSIENDTALMMVLANKFGYFISEIINNLFGNTTINFKYLILPVTYYNRSDYITDTFKLAQSGYSFLLPAIAAGVSQRDLVNLKEVENDVLKLGDILKPLSSAYTQSAADAGRPTKSVDEKSPRTLANEESLDNQ